MDWRMDCTDARTAISARLDGEDQPSTPSEPALEAHLRSCADCRDFETTATAMHRRLRLRPAEPVPDLSAPIVAALEPADDGRIGSLRAGLAVVAAVQILIALPALILGDDAGLPAHTARHLGSFAVALGIGFLVAAWRPERVGGVLPLTAALVLCLLLTSSIDVASSRANALSELGGHATELVGLGLLWLLARETGAAALLWPRRHAGGPVIS
jgi:predicted anti-sigma-YlaC factor YlaD